MVLLGLEEGPRSWVIMTKGTNPKFRVVVWSYDFEWKIGGIVVLHKLANLLVECGHETFCVATKMPAGSKAKAISIKAAGALAKHSDVIVIYPEVAKMKYILSDVRAVLGVTIVNNKEYQSGNPSSQYEYAYLDVKIDPSPFPKGLSDTANIVNKVEKDIKAIRGVVTFKLKEKAHDVKTWTISETPDPQSGKSAPYGSGYAPFKKIKK
jgi:hypothetical protein